jgi:hypothetical protein
MYFSVNTGNGYHIWRQRFPDGAPEQVTFGATEEEGIAFFPDGRSFATTVGIRQSTFGSMTRGDRQITSGIRVPSAVSSDGKSSISCSVSSQRYVGSERGVPIWRQDNTTSCCPISSEHCSISQDGSRIVSRQSMVRESGRLAGDARHTLAPQVVG